MNEMAAFALFTVPLLCFVSAGMLEFQRDRGSLRNLTRMLPLAVAVVVSIVLLIDVYYPYFSFRLRLSRAMSALSLLVAVSALVCRYKSRLTAALIFIGGLVLAFFWLLNRWVA
jgi:glucose-6-phosphate-specific signal transduction histidine kinase